MGKVKRALFEEQEAEHEAYMRDREPDFDDYALAKKAKDKDDYHEWAQIDESGEYCATCDYCERTKDAYGTGDSPTLRECMAPDPSECPGLM